MNWGIYLSGFLIGTIKYLFSHGAIATIGVTSSVELGFFEIFVPTYLGAIVSMAIFYFASEYFMHRALKKKNEQRLLAIEKGLPWEEKKKFTRMNKFLVKTKMKFGIYVMTIIAPLFFSIPLGSVVCAKFYGHKYVTFPLMVLFTGLYGLIMTTLIILA